MEKGQSGMNSAKTEFVKFVVVGVGATIVNYAVFLLLLYGAGIDYIVASAAGYLVGVLVGFTFNKKFTFSSGERALPELAKYFSIYLISLFLGLSVLGFLVKHLGIAAAIANILVIGITTCTNFLGSKFFTFKKIEFPKIFTTKFFIVILVMKIIASFLFASDFLLDGTIPFANYFVTSGFADPYQHFLDIGLVKAFPYSTTMLAVVSAPFFLFSFLPESIFGNIHFQMFLARIPLIIADIGIFFILLKLLKTREKDVL
ncbi:MAG: hypothetical protein COV47_02535, partial [Candidatus Diapherotrites archaeon CG11_big_fil_rev_8_21_14_0_20_37_9]